MPDEAFTQPKPYEAFEKFALTRPKSYLMQIQFFITYICPTRHSHNQIWS